MEEGGREGRWERGREGRWERGREYNLLIGVGGRNERET